MILNATKGKITKALLVVFLCSVITILFSGCDSLYIKDSNQLMVSPSLNENQKAIKKALTDRVGTNIILQYPSKGNYRSAFIETDLDGDNVNEVVAFYKYKDKDGGDNTHINILRNINDSWLSIDDTQGSGYAINSVDFININDNKSTDIVCSFETPEKNEYKMLIYSVTGLDMPTVKAGSNIQYIKKIYEQDYNIGKVMDLNDDFKNDIVLVHKDNINKTSVAIFIQLSDSDEPLIHTAQMDGSVTEYVSVTQCKIKDDYSALVVDGAKGKDQMISEVVVWSNGELLTPLYSQNAENPTTRKSTMTSRDIDGDGIIEFPIPVSDYPSVRGQESPDQYLFQWKKLNGTSLSSSYLTCAMNLNDGYFFTIPQAFERKFIITRDTSKKSMTFYSVGMSTNQDGVPSYHIDKELFSIEVFSTEQWSKSTEYKKVYSTTTNIYGVKISSPDAITGLTIDEDFVKANLNIL